MTCGIFTSGMIRGCLTVYGAIYPATSITVTTFGGITPWAWIYTPAEKSWFPWFRFYGPEKTLFDKSWTMPDIKMVKQ
jgi:hypothetical protein